MLAPSPLVGEGWGEGAYKIKREGPLGTFLNNAAGLSLYIPLGEGSVRRLREAYQSLTSSPCGEDDNTNQGLPRLDSPEATRQW